MRKLIAIPLLFLGSLIFSSYHGGAAYWGNVNCTGAEKNNPKGCSMNGAGCHTNTGSALIQMRIDLLDANNKIVTQYIPKQVYKVRLTAYNKRQDTLPTFGFQLLCMQGDSATSNLINAGSFDTMNLGTDVRYTASKNGIYNANIIEQNDRALAISGNGLYGSKYQVDAKWTAPDSGFGQISFWAVVNTSNNDGHNGVAGGEYWNTKHVAYAEGVEPANLIKSIQLTPTTLSYNQSRIQLQIGPIETLEVYSLDGQKIPLKWMYKSKDSIQIQWIQQPDLGIYILQAKDTQGQFTSKKILIGIE